MGSYIKFYMNIKLSNENELILMYRQFMLVNAYQFSEYDADEETSDQGF